MSSEIELEGGHVRMDSPTSLQMQKWPNMRPPDCPRQCRCFQFCVCKVCAYRPVRIASGILAFVLLFYVVWAIAAAIVLMGIGDAPYTLVSTHVGDICSNSIPFTTTAMLKSASMFEVQLKSVSARIRHVSGGGIAGGGYIGHVDWTGNIAISKGMNNIIFDGVFSVGDINTLAVIASGVVNTTTIDVIADITTEIHVPNAFWFPVTKSVKFSASHTLNAAVTPSSSSAVVQTVPSPRLQSVQIESQPNATLGYDLQLFTKWTIYKNASDEMKIYVNVPLLYVDAVYQGQHIGTGRVNPFAFSPISDANIDFLMAANVTTPQLSSAQNAISSFMNGANFYMQISGAPQRPVSSYCMIQSLVDVMPSIYVPVKGQTPSTSEETIDPETGKVKVKEPVMSPKAIEVLQVNRNNTNRALSMEAWLAATINLPFTITGRLIDVYLDVYSKSHRLGYLKIDATDIPTGTTLVTAVVAFIAEAESLVMERVRSYTSLNALGLSVTGRQGINLLSSLLGAVTQNISDTTDTSGGGSSSISNSTLSTNVSMVITTTDETFGIAARLFSPTTTTFSIFVPSMIIIVRSSTGGDMLAIATHEVNMAASSSLIVQMKATVNMSQADSLGIALDDLIDGKYITIDVIGNGGTVAKQSLLPVRAHVSASFTYDTLMGFINSSSTSGSSSGGSSASSPVDAFHIEPLSLIYNTSYIRAGIALAATWKIDITGDLPPVAVRILDSVSLMSLADLSTSAFTIAVTNSSFVTKVMADVWQQSTLYNTLTRSNDIGLTNWTITGLASGANPVSKVLSHLTYTLTPPSLSSSSGRRLLLSSVSSSLLNALAINLDSNSTNALVVLDAVMDSPGVDLVIGTTDVNIMHAVDVTQLCHVTIPPLTLDSSSSSTSLGANIMFAATDSSYLRHTFGKWLNGYNMLPIRVAGTLQSSLYGNGIIDVRYDVPSLAIGLNSSSSSSGSSGISGDSSISVLGVYPLGTGTVGQPVVIPCLRAGLFCPYDATELSSTPIAAAIDLQLPSLPFPVTINMSPLTIDIKCCVYSPLATVTVSSISIDDRNARVMAVLTPVDLPLLQQAFLDVTDSLSDVTIRVATSTTTDLMSAILSDVISEVKQTVSKMSTSGAAVDAQGRPDYSFAYALTQTTSNSATFGFNVGLRNPMSFTWDLGRVNISAMYNTYEIASSTFPFALRAADYNTYAIAATMHGEEPLSTCSGSTLAHPAFCHANEAIAKILSQSDVDGVPLLVQLTYINVLGQKVTVNVNLAVYATDQTNPRDPAIRASTSPLKDVSVQKASTLFNLITQLTGATFNVDAIAHIQNPVAIPIQITRIGFDMYMKDLDGVDNYWYIPAAYSPAAPDLAFNLAMNYRQSFTSAIIQAFASDAQMAVSVPLSYDGAPQAMVRVYDDYVIKDRFCVFIRNGIVEIQLNHGSDVPLIVTQPFEMNDISVVGDNDCTINPICSPTLVQLFSMTGDDSLYQRYPTSGKMPIWSGDQLRLCNNDLENGVMYKRAKQSVIDGWSTTFTFQTYVSGSWSRADGISFIIQNNALTAISTPELMGGDTIPNSLSVQFNTYNKYMRVRTTTTAGLTSTLPTQLDTTAFSDGNLHTVRIVYEPSKSRLFIYLDAALPYIVNVDIASTLSLDAGGKAWIGFGASTGDYYYGPEWIRSWTFSQVRTNVTRTRVVENGRVITQVGVTSSFTIDARDSCALPRRTGGDVWTVELRQTGQSSITGLVATDLNNGQYNVAFTANVAGTWQVYAYLASYAEGAVIGTIKVTTS